MSWTCAVCTFVETNELFLSCSCCGAPREPPEQTLVPPHGGEDEPAPVASPPFDEPAPAPAEPLPSDEPQPTRPPFDAPPPAPAAPPPSDEPPPAPAAPQPSDEPPSAPAEPRACPGCSRPCRVAVSRSANNPGRPFWVCPKDRASQCEGWIGWADGAAATGRPAAANIGSSGRAFSEVRRQEQEASAREDATARDRNENFARGDMRQFDKRRAGRSRALDARAAGTFSANVRTLDDARGGGGGKRQRMRSPAPTVVAVASSGTTGGGDDGVTTAMSVEAMRAARLAALGGGRSS